MSKFKIYAKSVLIPLIIGGIVGWIMSSNTSYDTLKQPAIAPPDWLFPVVWAILYILMGISYGLLQEKGLIDKKANIIYYLQLGVNALWSIIFFVWELRLLAFFWIVLLLILVIMFLVMFYKRNKVSGLIQIPYLLWTTFANYLNLAVYILNR